jgi:hypothetical protein
MEDLAAAWHSFAMAFAASASAAGDYAAAQDAAGFALDAEDSAAALEPFGAAAVASLLWCDPGTASIMEAAAVEAEAAGLSPMEVLMAQQKALLQEAQAASSSSACSWAAAAAAAAAPSSPLPLQRAIATPPRSPAVNASPRDAFPALASSTQAPCASQPGKSPHSLPHGWRGGRNVRKAKGIRVLNSSSSSDSYSIRPSQQDLHYGLMIDGLKLKDECPFEAAGAAGGAQLFGADAATAAATRQLLLAEQAAAAARGSGAAAASRDSCSQEAIRSMLDRPGKGREGVAADSSSFNPVLFAIGNKVMPLPVVRLCSVLLSVTGAVPEVLR